MYYLNRHLGQKLRLIARLLRTCWRGIASIVDRTAKASSIRQQRQAGSIMVELLAGITVMGTVAAVAMSEREDAEALALRTHAQMTASALASAVQLQQAKWLVNNGSLTNSPLSFNANGIPMGADTIALTTKEDCDLLWQSLISAPVNIDRDAKNWQAYAQGYQCQFSYHHQNLPAVSIWYHTQTGDITYGQ